MMNDKPADIEQRRRDFKIREPLLYEYIAHIEATKVLDGAGDAASGARSQYEAANRIWRQGQIHRERARNIRE